MDNKLEVNYIEDDEHTHILIVHKYCTVFDMLLMKSNSKSIVRIDLYLHC